MSDTISRKAAKDALNHELRCGAVINQCGLEMAYEIIEDLPSAELGTNLAEVGTDAPDINVGELISRSSLLAKYDKEHEGPPGRARKLIEEEPPVHTEIIYCKDCRKHNKKIGFDENFHTIWKEDACPLASWRGKAQGHEFDYQYCAYAERRTE